MKVLVVLSAVFAVALAKPGFLGAARAFAAAPALAYSAAPAVVAAPYHAGYAAYGPANIVIGADGVPLDTPEVAASKAAHLHAVAQTEARDAIVNSAAVVAAAAPAIVDARAYAAPAIAAHALGYAAAPAIAAHALGYAAAPAISYSAAHPGYAAYGPANIVIGPGGVPLDTPEVAAGKVADAVAHIQAKARNGIII